LDFVTSSSFDPELLAPGLLYHGFSPDGSQVKLGRSSNPENVSTEKTNRIESALPKIVEVLEEIQELVEQKLVLDFRLVSL
jgi:hypothetical protein